MTQTKFIKLPLIFLISIISIFTASADDTFVKVTNTDDLQGGGVYLLVYESTGIGSTKNAYFPISYNNEGYFETTNVSRSNNSCTINSSKKPITIILKKDGESYTLQSIDGKYLSCKESSGGIEFVSENVDVAKWSISISQDPDLITTIKNKQYTSYSLRDKKENSNHQISAYSNSGSERICLYRKTETTQTISAQTTDNNYITTYGDMQDAFLESPALAYYATVQDNEITFKAIERTNAQIGDKTLNGTYIPKNTGTVIRSTSPEIKIHAVPANDCNPLPYTNYLQVGNGTSPTEDNTSYYKLTYSDSNRDPASIGFYYGKEDGEAFPVSSGKAYLAIPKEAGIQAATRCHLLTFEDYDTSTGVIEKVYTKKEYPTYNIIGQRTNATKPNSIVIKNGKKFILH